MSRATLVREWTEQDYEDDCPQPFTSLIEVKRNRRAGLPQAQALGREDYLSAAAARSLLGSVDKRIVDEDPDLIYED